MQAPTRKGLRKRDSRFSEDDREVLQAVENLKREMALTRQNLNCVTDETLINCYIYELKAIEMKYQYFLRLCKEKGLTAVYHGVA